MSVPTNASRRPSGDQTGCSAKPGSATSSLGFPPRTATSYRRVFGRMSASGSRIDVKASRFPDGCHDGCETSKSPFVTWRGRAPGRAATTKRCERRSFVPLSSCQSVVRMTRATCFLGSPVQNRTSSPEETNAIVWPSGDQSGAPTLPCGALQTRSASPPSGSIR